MDGARNRSRGSLAQVKEFTIGRIRRTEDIMLAVLLGLLLVAPPAVEVEVDTALVCPAEFRAAMQPWIEYRTGQGHRIGTIDAEGTAEQVAARVHELARRSPVRFVVLVGDAEPNSRAVAAAAARCVPTHVAKAKVNVHWGSEPTLATDAPYADFNSDGAPDAAIGRLTADTAEELTAIIRKTIDYERSADFGRWRRQINCVAGVGGFGVVADAVLESSARYFLTQNVPPAYRVSMTYGSWRSPYCPDPRQFRETVIDGLNDGSWFWVYIGHGQPFGLDRARMPDRQYPIFDNADAARLASRHGSTIAVFLSCYVGAFDASDCLGEELLRRPGGPVAVLAGSRVAMPYAMSVMASGLMEEVFAGRCPTLGEAVWRAKRRLLEPAKGDDEQRKMLDSIAATLSPSRELLADERAEHVLLFNILGDPLLRLRHPQPLEVSAPAKAMAGDTLTVSGLAPFDGQATVDLCVRRGRLATRLPVRRAYPLDTAELGGYQEAYLRANDTRLASVSVPVVQGRFQAQLRVPLETTGECQVDAFVEGAAACALGSTAITLERRPSAD
jgi:hypothetical protein